MILATVLMMATCNCTPPANKCLLASDSTQGVDCPNDEPTCTVRNLKQALVIANKYVPPSKNSPIGWGSTTTITLTANIILSDLADDKRSEAKEAETKANQLRAEASDLDFMFKVMKACAVKE